MVTNKKKKSWLFSKWSWTAQNNALWLGTHRRAWFTSLTRHWTWNIRRHFARLCLVILLLLCLDPPCHLTTLLVTADVTFRSASWAQQTDFLPLHSQISQVLTRHKINFLESQNTLQTLDNLTSLQNLCAITAFSYALKTMLHLNIMLVPCLVVSQILT